MPSIPDDLLRRHVPRQRWYAGSEEPASLEIDAADLLREDWPLLLRLLVTADGICYQVLVGLRPEGEQLDFLRGHEDSALGSVDVDGEAARAYDATFDPELGLHLYWHVTGGDESAQRVRPIGVEQSNTSLVYDERFVLKLFRRLLPGANPEVEVTSALSRVGFPWVAEPLATESDHGFDLALVQPFLAGAVDGWALALTSLRDLFGVHDTQSMPVIDLSAPPPALDPAQAGGDFSGEARRLGETTALMHIAMADAFGQASGDGQEWADYIEAQARRALGDVVPALAILDELRLADPGPAIRAHGDYHLGQVMRTDAGWYVLDFEGEPDRPLEERQRPTSPLRDVAGMLRSLHYASAVALTERDGDEFDQPAAAWEARNRQAFLDGYLPVAAKGGILPADQASVDAVLAAFELEKAVYELSYERAHRPDWEHIPRTALRRLGVGLR
ncbi:MAG: maltokinase [Actinomycetota bacterium]|nr:maltokinase [Actinomycetota bacterium]